MGGVFQHLLLCGAFGRRSRLCEGMSQERIRRAAQVSGATKVQAVLRVMFLQ